MMNYNKRNFNGQNRKRILLKNTKTFNKKYNVYEIEVIKDFQKIYKLYFRRKVRKIIYIQKIVKGWFTRKILREINSLNKKITKFIFIIQIIALYHAIKFDFHYAYKKTHKKRAKLTKKFLFLQSRIKKFILLSKIQKVLKNPKINHTFIKIPGWKKIDKKFLILQGRPIIKKTFPISKILILQKNIRYFYFYNKVRKLIPKKLFKKNYFFTKKIRIGVIRRRFQSHINVREIEKMIFLPTQPLPQSFYIKKHILLVPITRLQRCLRRFFKYKKLVKLYKNANTRLFAKLNKHSFFKKIIKKDKMREFLFIQKEIKYFLFRLRTSPLTILKVFLNPMILRKKIFVGKINNPKAKKEVQVLLIVLSKIVLKKQKQYFIKVLKKKKEEKPKYSFIDIQEENIDGSNMEYSITKNLSNISSFSSNKKILKKLSKENSIKHKTLFSNVDKKNSLTNIRRGSKSNDSFMLSNISIGSSSRIDTSKSRIKRDSPKKHL